MFFNTVSASAFECDLLCSQRGVNPTLGMTLLKNGDVVHKDQLFGMFESREKCCMNMKMCERIQKLNLTDRELALCLAVVATFSGKYYNFLWNIHRNIHLFMPPNCFVVKLLIAEQEFRHGHRHYYFRN